MKSSLVVFFCLMSFFLRSNVPFHTGEHVSDYAEILTNESELTLNDRLEQFEKETGNEIVVLTVASLEGQDIETYATQVFKVWQIGKKQFDNGVLLLVSTTDRKIRIEVGYGLEGELTDGEAGDIIRQIITPYFKSGNYNKGIEKGLEAIVNQIKGYHGVPDTTSGESSYSWMFFSLFGLAMALIAFLVKKYKRNKPRRSDKTGERMFKLKENEEDQFLSKEKQLEEKIGSVDYDVWVTADHGDVKVVAYHSNFTAYTGCPKCRVKAFYKVSQETIIKPTYNSYGKGEKVYACKHCGHEKIKRYKISRKVKSSGGGYYAGGSGGGFSGGGFSGGGGSSGGGGASGSW